MSIRSGISRTDTDRYSILNAVTGSTRIAFLAGTSAANAAITMSANGTLTNVAGSNDSTP